jgi:hypothetical protein
MTHKQSLGYFSEDTKNFIEETKKSQLCQRPDGSIYGIPIERECITGRPISDIGEVSPLETRLRGALTKIKELGVPKRKVESLVDKIARLDGGQEAPQSELIEAIILVMDNISDSAKEGRNSTLENPQTVIESATQRFGGQVSRIDEAYQSSGGRGAYDLSVELEAAKVAYESARSAGQQTTMDLYERQINELTERLDNVMAVQSEFESIRQTFMDRGNREQANQTASEMMMEGLGSEHRFSPESYQRQLEELYTITNNRVDTLGEIFQSGDRGYAYPPEGLNVGSINVGDRGNWESQRSLFWHEFGHHIEYSNPEIQRVAQQWRDSRATSNRTESLNTLVGGDFYGGDERALPGNFFDPYVGKVYDEGYTEVIAMGLQFFDSPTGMRQLYERDREHFLFIVGILNSLE